ncbi:MAG: sulfatase [Acidobacteriota bacterium]
MKSPWIRFSCQIALLTLVCLLQSGWKSPADDAPGKPNIVFILTDDLGWSDLSCYGSEYYETPHLDRLAGEGMRFTDAYAACPVCSPSRAGILTGRYPARLHLTDYLPGRANDRASRLLSPQIRQSLPLEEITIAEALKSAGYATACIGKWHLSADPQHVAEQGFDVVVGSHLGQTVRNFYFSPYGMPNLADGPPGEYLTDRLTAEAVKFIEDHQKQPFFLYLSHYAVHSPLQAKKEDIEKWRRKVAQLRTPAGPNFLLEPNPDEPGAAARALARSDSPDDSLTRRMTKVRQVQDSPVMASMLQSLDEGVGRLLSKLEELGLANKTVVVFTSDNGGLVSQRQPTADFQGTASLPLRGGKGWLYEGGVRVPLIVRWPGKVRAGCASDQVVMSTDFYPTILEMGGLSIPKDRVLDGVSLVPVLRGKGSLNRAAVFWHWPHYSNHGRQSPGGAIRAGDYKLIEYFENGTLQLFNLRADTGEKNDLATKIPEKANELRGMLQQWRRSVDAQMPTPNPAYKQANQERAP